MAKKEIAAGLSGLLNPTPAQGTNKKESNDTEERTGRKIVLSFSIDETTAEKIRYIAYYDRKTQSAVIAEALAAYIAQWKPAPQEKPRKL